MRRILRAIVAALALALPGVAIADQSGGCLPTVGTYSGLTAAGYINAGFTSIFSSSSGASPPSNPCGGNPLRGQFWLNTSSGTLQPLNVYDGTQWLTVGSMDQTAHQWVMPPFPSQLLAADGTLSLPAISFASDPNTGIYHTADGTFAFVSNGVVVATVAPGSVAIPNMAGLAQGQVRLVKIGANLVLAPFNGNQLTIGGVNRTVPSVGVSLPPTGLATSTRYYIYAFMSGTTMVLEASNTAYVVDAGNGSMIKSGDPSRALVGMVHVGVGPAFFDTPANRLVASWFNQRPRYYNGFDCCGTIAVSQTTISWFNAASTSSFLSWANNSTSMTVQTSWDLADNGVNTFTTYMALAIDQVAQGTLCGQSIMYNTPSSIGNTYYPATLTCNIELSEGLHSINLAAAVIGGTALAVTMLVTSGIVMQ